MSTKYFLYTIGFVILLQTLMQDNYLAANDKGTGVG